MTIEDAIFEFIEAAVAAAQEGEPLFKAEVHDTVYQRIKQDYGVRVGDCESDLAPAPGAAEVQEFDTELTLIFYARVAGADKSNRKAARNQVRELALAVAKLIFDDPSIGGQVFDCLPGKLRRGYDSITDADEYAVANLPLRINQTEQQLEG